MTARHTLAVLAVVALGATASAQTLFRTSFEASDADGNYTTGALSGQPGTSVNWLTLSGTAEVTNDSGIGAPAGSQFVLLDEGAQIDRDLSSLGVTQNIIWVEGWFRGTGSAVSLAEANYPTAEQGTQASAVIHFSAVNGVELLNGTRGTPAEATVVPTNISEFNPNTWYRITLRLNFTTQSWDAYADGIKLNEEPLGFRDNVTALNGFRNLSEARSYFDGFRVVRPMDGDANGDNETDSADLIAMIEYVAFNPDSYDPIFVANVAKEGILDENGRLVVSSNDVLTLTAQILNDEQ